MQRLLTLTDDRCTHADLHRAVVESCDQCRSERVLREECRRVEGRWRSGRRRAADRFPRPELRYRPKGAS